MSRESLRRALFDLVEQITRAELRVSSQKLLLTYFNDSPGSTSAERARNTVARYTQEPLPSRADIAERQRSGTLTRLDRLVLAMEREADEWDRS